MSKDLWVRSNGHRTIELLAEKDGKYTYPKLILIANSFSQAELLRLALLECVEKAEFKEDIK